MKAIAVKSFRGVEGLVRRGEKLDVSEQRYKDLERHGLVKEAKLSKEPKNKAAQTPYNKAAKGKDA